MPQSKKSTTPRTPASRTSRGMSEGPKSTAQKPSTMRAMDDKPKGIEKSQKATAKSNRARRSDSGA